MERAPGEGRKDPLDVIGRINLRLAAFEDRFDRLEQGITRLREQLGRLAPVSHSQPR
jgi:hypothetical protein